MIKSAVMVLSIPIATIMLIFMVRIVFFLIVAKNDNTIAMIAAQS